MATNREGAYQLNQSEDAHSSEEGGRKNAVHKTESEIPLNQNEITIMDKSGPAEEPPIVEDVLKKIETKLKIDALSKSAN